MQIAPENLIPLLFKVLFGFVGLNIIVNIILLYTRRQRINKLLAIYWPIVLVMYCIQGQFQDGNLSIALAYSSGMAASLVSATIGFEAIHRKLPLRAYLLFLIPFYPLTYWLDSRGHGFTVVAMPFAIATALPLLHTFIRINILDFERTTRLQKVLGIVYFFHAIHCINFALFRMVPGAQLWGWLTSYILCDLLAILLPSIALEMASLTENERLQNLVNDRTLELNKSLKTNESLFKVLLHDISNPLTVVKGYIHLLKDESRTDRGHLMEKIQQAQIAMEDIITHMKKVYLMKSKTKLSLAPVSLDDCFKEISFIFEQPLKHKNVSLRINNHLSPQSYALADQTSLTHSVLSNLVSNGIKFNSPHSMIEITAKEDERNIILEIKDEGPGIPEDVIQDILENKELMSTDGTGGEKGSGLGLSIVKSFVDSYGGRIEFDSNFMHVSKDYGTNIRITLDKAPRQPLSH